MAASVIVFPKKAEPAMAEVEALIRKWLAAMAVPDEAIEPVTARMMAFIGTYATKTFQPAFDLPVPPDFSRQQAEALLRSIEKGLDDAAREVQEMVNRIIIERLFLEIEIYEKQSCSRSGWKHE